MLDEVTEAGDISIDDDSPVEMSLDEILSQPFCSAPNVISCIQRCRNQAPDGVICRDACDVCVGGDSADDPAVFVSGDIVHEEDGDIDLDAELLDDEDVVLDSEDMQDVELSQDDKIV